MTSRVACEDKVCRNGTIRCTNTPFAAIINNYVKQYTPTPLIRHRRFIIFKTCREARVVHIFAAVTMAMFIVYSKLMSSTQNQASAAATQGLSSTERHPQVKQI